MHASGLTALHDQGGMTWTEPECGWVAVPEEVLQALAVDGFEQCKHEETTSRRDRRPSGGVWQGVNPATGAVASAIWVADATGNRALVFIDIDGEPVVVDDDARKRGDVSCREEGGEG